jgi:hypothetical protein
MIMSETFIESITLEKLTCGNCGIVFAVPSLWLQTKRTEGGEFSCPNKCARIFRESENARLKKELEAKQRELVEQKCETLRQNQAREAAEASSIALSKSKERLARRVRNGVCPCCNRTFSNLAAHMKTKHPEKSK